MALTGCALSVLDLQQSQPAKASHPPKSAEQEMKNGRQDFTAAARVIQELQTFFSWLPRPLEFLIRRCRSWRTRAVRRRVLLALRPAAPFALLSGPSV